MSSVRVMFSAKLAIVLSAVLIAICHGLGADFIYPDDHDHNHGRRGGNYHHHHHRYEDQPDYDARDRDDSSSIVNDTSQEIPLEFAKNLNDYNVSDWLLNFVEGPEDFDKPLFISTRFGETDESNSERNAATIPKPAKCMPELQTVKIATSDNPSVMYIPQCTRVERCGGCCSHVLLSCQPVKTDTLTFQVMKTEYTGAKKLRYVGKELVLVEKHVSCKCNCKVKAEDCSTYQEYREGECRCVCKNLDEEKKCSKLSSKKLWNPDACACQCREIMPCSTGYTFDYNECRCIPAQVKRRYVLTEEKPEEPLD